MTGETPFAAQSRPFEDAEPALSQSLEALAARAMASYAHTCAAAFGAWIFHLASDVDAPCRDFLQHLSGDPEARPGALSYDISYDVNDRLAAQVRRFCERHGAAVLVKEDYRYRTARTGSVTLFASDFPEEEPPHVLVQAHGRSRIVVASTSAPARRAPLRVAREVLLRGCEDQSAGILVHGAVVDLHGQGILITGDGGAGKTSTMWRLIRASGGDYVSNDRCIISLVGSRLECVSYPLAVRFGAGFIKSDPMWPRIAAAARHRDQVAGVTRSLVGEPSEVDSWANVNKLELTPAELADLAQCRVVSRSEVKSVVYVNLGPNGQAPAVHPISRADASSILRRNIFAPGSTEYQRPWLGLVQPDRKALVAQAERLHRSLLALPSICLAGDPRQGPVPVSQIGFGV